MPVLAFHCSLCRDQFKSKAQWNEHLLQNRHQQLARRELLNWEEPDRACVLVVYGTVAVGKDLQIIQHLSKDLRTFVTDFVWWEERPRVGFLQFESEAKVREVVSSLVDQQFRLGDKQFCEVKEGRSIREPEWVGLLPDCMSPNLREESPEKNEDPGESVIDVSTGDQSEDGLEESEAMATEQAEEVTETSDDDSQMETEAPSENEPTPEGPAPSNHNGPELCHYLNSIRKLVEIPDHEFHAAMDILRRAQGELLKLQRKGDPSRFTALISKHWGLKLQYWQKKNGVTGSNLHFALLIYKYLDTGEDPHVVGFMPGAVLDKVLDKFLVKNGRLRHFLSYRLGMRRRVQTSGSQSHGIARYEIKLPNSGRPFNVVVVADSVFIVEAQTWRLTKYMCEFDGRCAAVLAVIYYWANINSVMVGSSKGSFHNLPDPSSLNWLLILFFQMEGLIPSAKQVLAEPHQALIFKDKGGRGTDIGFSDCPQFPSRWMKEKRPDPGDEGFAEEVFTLVYRFFLFCSDIKFDGEGETKDGRGTWVLNTRDAELIKIQKGRRFPKSKFSQTELKTISKYLTKNDPDEKLIMLSPFSIVWRMSTANAASAFQAMGVTGRKLKDYLDNDKRSGSSRSPPSKASVDSFLQLFKL